MINSLSYNPISAERGFLCNTWGLNSIGFSSFGYRSDGHYTLGSINIVKIALKITYFALDVLGYIPGIATTSGMFRFGLAVLTGIGVEVAIDYGAIIGPYIEEARGTVHGQMVRAFFEMVPFYGQIANGTLDIVHTVPNIVRDVRYIQGNYQEG